MSASHRHAAFLAEADEEVAPPGPYQATPVRRRDTLLAAALGGSVGDGNGVRSGQKEGLPARAQPAWVALPRQCAALLRRTVLLKCRGWRQTAAEVVVPVLLMAALVVGAQLAEIKVSSEDIFANKPPVSTLLASPRYTAFSNYYGNHTAAACARTQLFAAAASPQLATTYGWDTQALAAVAASDPAATRAVLAAFNISAAQLLNAQAALAAVNGVSGLAAIAVGLGVGDPQVIDALQAVQANLLNGSAWSAFADVSIPALLSSNLAGTLFGGASGNGTNSSSGSAPGRPGALVGRLFAYNGPIPVPSLDEFVITHLVVRAVFSRYSPAWTAYKELKTQLGYNLLGNLVELGGIAFMPNTSGVRALASALSARHASWDSYYKGAFDDIGTAREAATAGDPVVGPWAVVQFDSASPTSLRYAIRVRFTQVPSTWTVVEQFYGGLSTTYLRYITSGFLSIQRAIDEATLAGALSADPTVAAASVNSTEGTSAMLWSIPFPVYSVRSNSFYSSSGPLLGLVICLSMIYPLGMLIKGLVEEKETGARELLRISGLRHFALGVSWSLVYVLLFILIAGASTLVLGLAVFPHSGSDVLFGMLWLFMLSCVPLAFVISTAFTRARLAAIFGPFALFALILPRYLFFRTSGGQSIMAKRAACLLAPTAFTFAADRLASYEAGNSGVTRSNVWEGPLSVGECMAWMFLDTVLYSLLGMLLDYALPTLRRSGRLPQVALPWGRRRGGGGRTAHAGKAEDIQPEGADSASGAVIATLKALRKVFPNGVCAVDGLDLQLADGTITALLGHNGAGKTTAISMLTGNVALTSGTVTICGHSVAAAASGGLIGLCPQHNVLYPMLTVLDHLRMFAVLRGVPHARLTSEALDLVAEVGLQEQVRTRADALSGGMKRRLQLACALIGGARLILADEPTSGQDPINRRATWELLRKVRRTTSVLLTTHYLDEADLLADRVVILSDGCLRAAGSPLFLKRRLGRGYTLSVTTTGSAAEVEAVVQQHSPGALRVRSAGGELAFQLTALQDRGEGGTHASDFVALLSALEARREALALGGLGISNATLEEVFLRLAREAPATADTAAFAAASQGDDSGVEMDDLKRGGRRSNGASAHHDVDGTALATCLPFSPTKRRGAPLLGEPGAQEATTEEPRLSSTSPAFVTVDVVDASNGNGNGLAHDQHSQAPATSADETASPWEAGQLPSVRDAKSMQRSFRRAFTEMLRKRALIAKRDYKAVAFQIALPVLAVGLVMLILSLNVDPTGPALTLKATTLVSDQQVNATPVWWPAQAAGFPTATFTPAVAPIAVPASSLASVNSTVMSLQLLCAGNDSSVAPPYSYGAFVPRDVGLPVFLPALCLVRATTPAHAADTATRVLTKPSTTAGEEKLAGALGRSLVLAATEVSRPALAVLHNTSSPHALPIWMSELRAAALRAAGGPELAATNHPLPLTADEQTTLATFLRLLASFFVLIPYSYAPATAAAAVVRERASGAKLQQLASGASSLSYWASHFVFEMANLTVVIACCMLIFAGFGVDILVGTSDKAAGTFLLLWLYSLAAVALSFFLSLPFDSHAAAIVAIACFNFVTGFCLVTASFIMSVTPSTADLNKQLVVFFRIFPTYNLGEGLLNLALASFDLGGLASATGGSGSGSGNNTAVYTAAEAAAPQNAFGNVALVAARNAFEWNVLGRPLLLLLAEFCLLSTLVLLFHRGHTVQTLRAMAATYAAWLPLPGGGRDAGTQSAAGVAVEPDDETVQAEQARIQGGPGDVLQLRGIRKVYAPHKVAVHGLWLGVPTGERLGLLGVNGAGKTTTLAMLCCDVAPTSGDAVVDGASVRGAPQDVQRLIGYCPQKDPILELLTVREHLLLYARLKGMPEGVVHAAVESTWRRVGLGPFADRPAGTLSGGNKRKLSLAIAIVGNPVACILDEPSSGMDVQARRHLWEVISTSTADMAVILTTHALDEAEALCGRIGIMVSGRLKCVGTPLQLKQRFGDGHVIDIKAASHSPDDAERMLAHVQALLPEAHVVERHGGKMRLGVEAPLSRIFAALDQAPCEDWAVSQASMESVFCKIAA